VRTGSWLLLVFLAQPLDSLAAAKPVEQADKEMLRMIDFLKDWDVITNMELMKDLPQVPPEAGQPPRAGAREPSPIRKKEAAK
jgi:hypothetical protein